MLKFDRSESGIVVVWGGIDCLYIERRPCRRALQQRKSTQQKGRQTPARGREQARKSQEPRVRYFFECSGVLSRDGEIFCSKEELSRRERGSGGEVLVDKQKRKFLALQAARDERLSHSSLRLIQPTFSFPRPSGPRPTAWNQKEIERLSIFLLNTKSGSSI
jgi:hypothetical protein